MFFNTLKKYISVNKESMKKLTAWKCRLYILKNRYASRIGLCRKRVYFPAVSRFLFSYGQKSCMVIWQLLNKYTMGLLTILKKMKQKEKEVRLLMLYPLIIDSDRYIWFIFLICMIMVAQNACMILPVFID